ncbi:MAG: transcription antitermination factor NusB [Selenomonadaceae bacterium]|nr:transcription antitermination factor NusB [Selenomonadaceae bacterium]MBQ3726994.1 transcription antitermination factor NusB [Selenomonadaceae bacterium]MBQ9497667.1 transcription antitermination factor NusB [Selenomonadaceae bacterium]
MSRKFAREAAFKALFQLDFNFEEDRREECEDLAIETMFEDNPRLTKKDLAYIEGTVKGTRARLEEIDGIITAHLKEGWQLPRLMAADRNILRLAVYEMKFAEPALPKGVAINEAVELAKRYGTDDSGRFVNGILESISK